MTIFVVFAIPCDFFRFPLVILYLISVNFLHNIRDTVMRNGPRTTRCCNAFSTNSKSLTTCNPTLSLALVLLEFAYSCLECAMRYKKLTSNIFHKKIALGRVINYLWMMPKMAKDGSQLDCDHFQEKLNSLHPALKFTGAKQLLEFFRCFGRERGHWISYQHLQETDVYWAINPLDQIFKV